MNTNTKINMSIRQNRPRTNRSYRSRHLHCGTGRPSNSAAMTVLNAFGGQFNRTEPQGNLTISSHPVGDELAHTGWCCEQHTPTQSLIEYSQRSPRSGAVLLGSSGSEAQHGFGQRTDGKRRLVSQWPTNACRPNSSSCTGHQSIPRSGEPRR